MKMMAEIRDGKIDAVATAVSALVSNDRSNYASGLHRLTAALTGDKAAFEEGIDQEVATMRDPEGIFYWALMALLVGDADRAISLL